jgi:hypothetical protein
MFEWHAKPVFPEKILSADKRLNDNAELSPAD